MEIKKFFGAVDAAEYAATLTSEWKTEDGEIWDAKTLSGVMQCADDDHTIDEDDGDEYYLVDAAGALGYTTDDCGEILWVATPTHIDVQATVTDKTGAFCPQCGRAVEPGWLFCEQCGAKLK